MLALGRRNDSWRFLQPELTLREVVLEEALAAGIDAELVRTIIRSFGIKPRQPDIDNWPWPVKVSTLGKFEILVNDEPLEPSRKAPRRPLALLKAVIAFGSREVPKAKLVDALWTEEEGDAAQRDFDVALYRLRKLLHDPRAIVFEDSRISVDTAFCWVDVLEIERRFEQLEQALKRDDESQVETYLGAISRLYGGMFLPAETDAAWSVSMRERLRDRFVQAVQRGARRLEGARRWDEAIDWYGKALRVDDLAESLYQGLMRCYLENGQRAEGLTCYRRLRDCLAAGLNISPSTSSEALRRQLEAS
jgi:DNA-binding SARP family transcriptional activator